MLETVLKAFQVALSVEYCQVPLPVVAVTAIPDKALESTSAQLALVKKAETKVDALVVAVFTLVKLNEAALVIVGASLTAVILVPRLTPAAETLEVRSSVVVLKVCRVAPLVKVVADEFSTA